MHHTMSFTPSWLRTRCGLVTLLLLACCASHSAAQQTQPRVIVMADMGNESDEEQQMMHLLMYSNMFDIEGLIACSGKYLHSAIDDGFRSKVHPELFSKLIDGYAQVVDNLRKHATGWPAPAQLHRVVRAGVSDYGIEAVEPGRSNEASRLLEAAILKEDPRKLYIVVNAGANTLAQALTDLDESCTDEQVAAFCDRIVVFENGAQDNAGAWIASKYPGIHWHRSNHQTYAYGGPDNAEFGVALGPYTWEPYPRDSEGQDAWATEHIKTNHGPLGALFPYRNRFIEGGGTVPWIGLALPGLTDIEHLEWGGQSGRFSRTKHRNVLSRHPDIRKDELAYSDFYVFESDSESESWTDPVDNEPYDGLSTPVWRFRRSMFNDFRARMDWCVNEYGDANHNPIAVVGGDTSDAIIHLEAKPGQRVPLTAEGTVDPDGDRCGVRWWVYHEAGTYEKKIELLNTESIKTELIVPADASEKQIHVILEVQDDNPIVTMYDFRRVVVHVE